MPTVIQFQAACRHNGAMDQTSLTLHVATGFWDRLRGLHAYPPLQWGTGLYLSPCAAIQTFGMSYTIDVVFLDQCFNEIKLVDAMPPNRVVFCTRAASAVELSGGYCRSHPGYAQAIRCALGVSSDRCSRRC